MSSERPTDLPGDRRADERTPIELKVEYRRLNSFFADYTRNISKGGTFIATHKPLPIGTEFLFRLAIPTIEDGLQLRGRVAWVIEPERATAAQAAGMGIRFQYADDAERAEVQRIVEKLMADSLGPQLTRRLIEHSANVPGGGTDPTKRE